MYAQPSLTAEMVVAIIAYIEAKVALIQNSDLKDSMQVHISAQWI
jgi:hypothetical protein